MAKLLYVESSPRKERSTSIAVARAFLEVYQATNPGDTIDKIDLWNFPMPEFDGPVLEAKYAILHRKNPSVEQEAAWKTIVDIFERFASADKYLISLPMWNFGVPYKFKQFVDILTQPGLAFRFSHETGYTGLVTNRPVTVIYARGSEYPEGSDLQRLDLQRRYVDLWLGFIGFREIESIIVEPTLDPDRSEKAKRVAVETAREDAAVF